MTDGRLWHNDSQTQADTLYTLLISNYILQKRACPQLAKANLAELQKSSWCHFQINVSSL